MTSAKSGLMSRTTSATRIGRRQDFAGSVRGIADASRMNTVLVLRRRQGRGKPRRFACGALRGRLDQVAGHRPCRAGGVRRAAVRQSRGGRTRGASLPFSKSRPWLTPAIRMRRVQYAPLNMTAKSEQSVRRASGGGTSGTITERTGTEASALAVSLAMSCGLPSNSLSRACSTLLSGGHEDDRPAELPLLRGLNPCWQGCGSNHGNAEDHIFTSRHGRGPT